MKDKSRTLSVSKDFLQLGRILVQAVNDMFKTASVHNTQNFKTILLAIFKDNCYWPSLKIRKTLTLKVHPTSE